MITPTSRKSPGTPSSPRIARFATESIIVVDRAGRAKMIPAYQPPPSLADVFSATFG